jgi:hypothetical protein
MCISPLAPSKAVRSFQQPLKSTHVLKCVLFKLLLTLDKQIDAGDDCVSILSGTTDVNITDSTCGPGHGIRYKCTTMSMQACADQILINLFYSSK